MQTGAESFYDRHWGVQDMHTSQKYRGISGTGTTWNQRPKNLGLYAKPTMRV